MAAHQLGLRRHCSERRGGYIQPQRQHCQLRNLDSQVTACVFPQEERRRILLMLQPDHVARPLKEFLHPVNLAFKSTTSSSHVSLLLQPR